MENPPPIILVSAFEPFGGAGVNASQEIARHLSGAVVAIGDNRTAIVETLTVPVVAGDAERLVFKRLQNGPRPLAYLALGEAGPERVVRLEKVYINWDYFRIPDNAGNAFRNQSIVPTGPNAYFATLDFVQINAALTGTTPVPTVLSLSAGAFLCNRLAYAVSHHLAQEGDNTLPFGFVHVPSWRPANGEEEIAGLVETVRRLIGSVSRLG